MFRPEPGRRDSAEFVENPVELGKAGKSALFGYFGNFHGGSQ
jgi:hypothetical protein